MSQDSKPNRTELPFEERYARLMQKWNIGGHDVALIQKTIVQSEGDDHTSSNRTESNPRLTPR